MYASKLGSFSSSNHDMFLAICFFRTAVNCGTPVADYVQESASPHRFETAGLEQVGIETSGKEIHVLQAKFPEWTVLLLCETACSGYSYEYSAGWEQASRRIDREQMSR